MNEEISNLLEFVTAGEWGKEKGNPQGIDIGVIRSANFTKEHQFNDKDIVIRSIDARKLQKKMLLNGDILIEKSGGSPDQPVGRVLFYDLEGEHTCSNFISLLRPSKRVDSRFLYYSLCNLYRKRVVKNYQQQTTGIINLQLGEYLREKINFPPLPEQKKIAENLKCISKLIKIYEFKINKLKNIKKSTSNLLLEVSKIGSKESLRKVKLNSIAKGFIVPMRDKPKEFTGNIPWIRIEDFEGQFISKSKSGRCVSHKTVSTMNLKIYPLNTVLCSCSATLGICAIVKKPLVSNQTFIGIVPDQDKIFPSFLYYLLESKAKDLQKLSTGTTIAYLPRDKFESFEVTIPPKNEQKRIIEILDGIEENIKSLEEKIKKTKFIFTGLQENLLSGQKRVII